jgi:hypothetical protein
MWWEKDENTSLIWAEINLKQCWNNILAHLLRDKEIKWYQKAKVKGLLEGDFNTKYFQLIENEKHRKTRIFQPKHGDKVIGDMTLKQYITTYYEDLFDPHVHKSFLLDESIIDDITQVLK